MFATPPCQEQLRLAIVVEAETVPYVVGGSFLCEREETALLLSAGSGRNSK